MRSVMKRKAGSRLVVAVWLATVALSAGDHIDLDKPEPERIFLDNPWGGSPVVSSEVGAEPQAVGGACRRVALAPVVRAMLRAAPAGCAG